MKDYSLYHVAEEVAGKPMRIHKFRAPSNSGNSSQQSAYLAVRNFDSRQFRDPCTPFHVYQINEWETQLKVEDRWERRGVARLHTALPVVEHASVWDFFRAINWDAEKEQFNAP
ncbi:hypothetical protein MPK66_gp067 [Erwinia phage pEa_SNUABM_2]|uniref:Uncharacterized protein n=1 Tax=Erwinia phage pEa_SNUABM_2 TaxID=2869547 RepID=A0AAE7XPT5_9CAUD|nr:hypothetical protein MPK66_gp067 [Erwinia phage pEa_SNUABM_2]QZE59311.1 hypothetical protein pEaSNUABM2_00067 [Erwinia phage pEa_SNUABM_2]QZE59647.1 hypothetical protein pEaSNUABM39_00067 [Erwinia phage pEa_SNUABM_39]